jgi:hypothetical protein
MQPVFDFDVFVSHASEDKAGFVRPLVDQLADAGLSVWFDESTLRPGDSLVQSIEAGLARSRFGVVILSQAFFGRHWPRAELDGLTNRELATGERILLPVWLDVDADDVRGYSPLLADRYAIIGNRGVEYVASALARRIRPGGSPLAIARELLADRGLATPPPSDPWWLDVVESSTEPDYIDIHSGLLRWGFPLPPNESDATARGQRLAQAVMRDDWMAEADRRPIAQITEPEVVHAFIREMPGLLDTCMEWPSYLGAYAPQLLIRGFGGPFESLFDDWLARDQERGHSLDTIAWHLSDYSGRDTGRMACDYVQGELMGPSVKFYDEHIDYFFWALSERSAWLPEQARRVLVQGFCEWPVWPPNGPRSVAHDASRRLLDALLDEDHAVDLAEARSLLTEVAEISRHLVGLPEPADVLAERLVATGAIEAYRRDRAERLQDTPADT